MTVQWARWWVVGLLLATALTVACGQEPEARGSSISGLTDFDALDYYDSLKGDLAFSIDDVALPNSTDDGQSWRDLVERQRESGLSSLSEGERNDLLTGSVKAYLALVDSATIRYRSGGADAIAEEVYAANKAGLAIDLHMRRASYDG